MAGHTSPWAGDSTKYAGNRANGRFRGPGGMATTGGGGLTSAPGTPRPAIVLSWLLMIDHTTK
jgi:hypothetical protein